MAAKKGFSLNDILNAQSVQKKTDAFSVREIPIELLTPNPKNGYDVREKDIEELAANIDEFGLQHNLVVIGPNAEGKYLINSGERRYRACGLLHQRNPERFARLPCKVEAAGDETVQELQLLFANSTARELTDYEKTYQAARIKELLIKLKADGYKFKGRMREIVAEMLKVSPAQMGRMESIHDNLTDGLKEEFRVGKLTISDAYDASTLPPEKQEAALTDYRDEGAEAVKRAVRAQKKERREQRNAQDMGEAKTEGRTAAQTVQQEEKEQKCVHDMHHTGDAAAMAKEKIEESMREQANKAARELHGIADNVPYEATCEAEGVEINIRAACCRAAKLLEYFKGE